MTYSFTLSKAQHWRASRVVQSRTLVHKLAWAFFGGMPVLIVAVLAFAGADVWAFVESHPLGVLGGPLLMVAGFPLIQYWTVWMHHRNHPTLRGAQVFVIEPSHLGMKGPLHNTELSWDAVLRVVETREFMLFYIGKSVAYQSSLPFVRNSRSGCQVELPSWPTRPSALLPNKRWKLTARVD